MNAIWSDFESVLKRRTTDLISEHEAYLKWVHNENRRRSKRSNGPAGLVSALRPSSWDTDPGFNPYHVRSRHKSIAHSVVNALKSGTYKPRTPCVFEVPKENGDQRLVSTF